MARSRIKLPRYVPGHYRKVIVFDSYFERAVKVKGATYLIRKDLKLLGLRWDPKEKQWIGKWVDVDPDAVAKLLKSYGCFIKRVPSHFEADELMEWYEEWLCPWR